MSSKRKAAPARRFVKAQNADGSFTTLDEGVYNDMNGIRNQLVSGASTLDQQELMGQLNDYSTAFSDGRTLETLGAGAKDLNLIRAEAADAVAGQKPKYRYRKYLDQVSQMQQDQPGQLQTVLAKSGRGSILGGG